jgi:hypothetical protein
MLLFLDDLLYFSLDPWEAFESLTASLHKFFQHALTVSSFNSSITALMKFTASAMLKDFQLSMTWRFGSPSMAARRLGECLLP